MYCKYCGKVLDEDSKFCANCGGNVNNDSGSTSADSPSKAFAVLGFFLPLVGLILYAIYERKQPKRAKSAGKGALVGFITKVVISIIIFVFYIIFVSSVLNTTVGNFNVGTYNYSGDMEKEDDYVVEFGEFKVTDNGIIPETSLEVTLTNTDDEQKTFMITVEAVDENGMRLDTDVLMADRLNPNQKIKAELFKYVPKDKIKQFETATFKVLDDVEY